VSLWLTNDKQKSTTEPQRTQRLHREEAQTKTLPFCVLLCGSLSPELQ
jgi:hypothetical protein